ncbi:prolipoprotein diacylglyceryl transferase [Microvirga sp. STS02]|uniref:prolipoprotein diacylglyceryl transferase family protein n=1 Tax=Hymenobacter negativus TaxID=2795026 RepID=UPI0018DD5CC5|nr:MULTISPECIES: prolipoprotein diacylglyceryl transferase family protein [Bacteria]MBH8571153.1 prolipoprotein diacylglyceryl transferase [Hymenobacter negativus]MBR7210890.1 prolipoprotein diacylglyceryl transferase [Microvirga sp. STS02]
MLLPYAPNHDYYTPFYLLATLTNVLLLLWEGWRRGFPLRPWLTLVAASSLALILGTKLITHPLSEWSSLLFTNTQTDTARSILGGGLAAVLTLVALRRWLGLGWAVLDALALPLCAALVVQCVGCVLTGCCFGEPTSAAWGLTYAAGTPPWWAQVQAGLLPATAAHSLPVAPTQQLALLLCAVVGGVLLATRKRRWPVGSLLLLQTGLLLLGRFAQGFWRDAASEPVAGHVHTVLGGRWLELQLWLLPLGLLALGLWAWRVRLPAASLLPLPNAACPVPASRYLLVLAGLLVLTAVLSATALTPPETVVVKGLLLLVLAVEAGQLLATGSTRLVNQSTVWSLDFLRSISLPRLLPLGLAGVMFVLTSQAPAPADSARHRMLTLSLGGQQGRYDEDVTRAGSTGTSGCGGGSPAQRMGYYHDYSVLGGNAAYTLRGPAAKGLQTVGLGVWAGTEHVGFQPLPTNIPFPTTRPGSYASFPLYDINPYVEGRKQFRHLALGYRLGLHLGRLRNTSTAAADTTLQTVWGAPDAQFWLGNRRVLFGQIDTGVGLLALGNHTSRFGLGTGLGMDDGRYLLAGMAVATHEAGYNMGFVSANVRLAKTGLSIEPYAASDFGRHYQVNLRLNYRLGL